MSFRERSEGRLALLQPGWPVVPAIFALVCGALALLSAPTIGPKGPPAWLSPFFTTAATVIATLFVALALGARQVQVGVQLAGFTVTYVALGEVAAVAGLSTGLPHWVYAWLLAITVGAGIGALSSSVYIGAKAIGVEAEQAAQGQVDKMSGKK